jgi:hypothetical protein
LIPTGFTQPLPYDKMPYEKDSHGCSFFSIRGFPYYHVQE